MLALHGHNTSHGNNSRADAGSDFHDRRQNSDTGTQGASTLEKSKQTAGGDTAETGLPSGGSRTGNNTARPKAKGEQTAGPSGYGQSNSGRDTDDTEGREDGMFLGESPGGLEKVDGFVGGPFGGALGRVPEADDEFEHRGGGKLA